MTQKDTLERLAAEVTACALCARLVSYRASIGDGERTYWNRPVWSFGDPKARLVIIGLAPGAHGANRTGRPFTGDHAGVWLYRALHHFGFATRETSESRDDPLRLKDAWITNAVRCVPPENKPTTSEIAACAGFLEREMALLSRASVILALGKTAHDAWLGYLKATTKPKLRRADFPFAHGRVHRFSAVPVLVDSYHCSRYNTQTGVLKWEMFTAAFETVRRMLEE